MVLKPRHSTQPRYSAQDSFVARALTQLMGGSEAQKAPKLQYRCTKGHKDQKRWLTEKQIEQLRADDWTVDAIPEPQMVDNFEEIRTRGLQSAWKRMYPPNVAHSIEDTLGRGTSVNAPTKTGQSAHFKRWMNDAAFKKLVNKEVGPVTRG